MGRLPVRLGLLFTCIAAFLAAGFFIASSEQHTRASEAVMRTFNEGARRAIASATELRAAQQAYVAVGQGTDFWFARVAALEKEFSDTVAALKQQAGPDASLALEDAAGALRDFLQVDSRARDYVRTHQPGQASDLIFADGFDLTRKASAAIATALTAESVARDAAAAAARRTEALTASAAGAVALLIVGIFALTRRAEETPLRSVASAPVSSFSPDTLDDLPDFSFIGKAAAVKETMPEAAKVALDDVAALCGDLARLVDTRALPQLLDRAASVLNAAGIVVWIADPDGRELTPILVQGYPAHVANRLGTLARDAANLTAAAYRTALVQTVKADAVSNGAIAAPLISSAGCVGVLAVEMKDGGEQQHALLAAAGIIASQLSTLVGPPTVRRAEATG